MNGETIQRSNRSTAATVKTWLEKSKDAIARELPKGVNLQRFIAVAINAISTNPLLSSCTAESLFCGILKGFRLGLEVNGPLGEAYLVPFKDNKSGNMLAIFMPSYKGMIKLARQSGELATLYADCIKENDEYSIQRGTDMCLTHRIKLGRRGETIAYYAAVKFKDSSYDYELMTPEEIGHIRSKSKAKDSGPWVTDFDEMAKKTVLKRLLKRLPMSVENFAEAVQADNKAEAGEIDPIQIEGIDIPAEEFEKAETQEVGAQERTNGAAKLAGKLGI
jgi:recombination protein RecT